MFHLSSLKILSTFEYNTAGRGDAPLTPPPSP